MVDAKSKNSSNMNASETQSMASRKVKESAESDRKKLKVLKQALKDERAEKTALQEEIKTLQERFKE